MDTAILMSAHKAPEKRDREAGFSIIESLFAGAILFICLSGLLAMFSLSMLSMQSVQDDVIARQKAREALEAIFDARTTAQITFNQINNIASGGIFMDGYQPLRLAGADGIIGTADDAADPRGPIEFYYRAGPSGDLSNADKVKVLLSNFQRRITITPVNDAGGQPRTDLRQVVIDVQYTTARGKRTYTVSGLISRYR